MDKWKIYFSSQTEPCSDVLRNLLKPLMCQSPKEYIIDDDTIIRLELLKNVLDSYRFANYTSKFDVIREVNHVFDFCLSFMCGFDSTATFDEIKSCVKESANVLCACLSLDVVSDKKVHDIVTRCCAAFEEFTLLGNDHNEYYNHLTTKTSDNNNLGISHAVCIMTSLMDSWDILCKTVSGIYVKSRQEFILLCLLKTLPHLPDSLLKLLLHKILSKLVTLDELKLEASLSLVSEAIYNMSAESASINGISDSKHASHERSYLMLCVLANLLFPEDGIVATAIDLRSDARFWRLIQRGIWHDDTMTRRRCVYLLKRVVDICENTDAEVQPQGEGAALFWWHADNGHELHAMWDDFVQLVETLEEKQLHIIEPLFPKMDSLIEACAKRKKNDGFPHLHTSWVVAVTRRLLMHQSPHVVEWGVKRFLQIDFDRCPLITQGQHDFMNGELMQAFKNPHLYTSSDDPGNPPPAATLLQNYLVNCLRVLADPKEKAHFFEALLGSICTIQWGSAALFYVTLALSKLPPTPLWGPQSLLRIREIHANMVMTLEVYVRGAIETSLVRTLFVHLDLDRVEPGEVSTTLLAICQGDSLHRGSVLRDDLVAWLRRVVAIQDGHWSRASLSQWVTTTIHNHIAVSTNQHLTVETETPIALMFVLACDAGVITTSSVESALSPVTGALLGVNTHSYRSAESADVAIYLLASIVAELRPIAAKMALDDVQVIITNSIKTCVGEIYTFMARRISSEIQQIQEVDAVRAYRYCISQLLNIDGSGVGNLVNTCINILSKPPHQGGPARDVVRRYSALSLLSAVCTKIASSNQAADSVTVICDMLQCLPLVNHSSQTVLSDGPHRTQLTLGRLSSDCIHHHWQCLHFLAQNRNMTPQLRRDISDFGIVSMETCNGSTVPVIFDCLGLLIPDLLTDGEDDLVLRVFSHAWTPVCNDVREVHFWTELRAYVRLVFQPATVRLDPSSPILCHLLEKCDLLHAMSSGRAATYNTLISHLFAVLERDDTRRCLPVFTDIVTQASVYSAELIKPERQWLELCAHISSLGPTYSPNNFDIASLKPAIHTRIIAIRLLTKLSPDDVDHRQVISGIMRQLVTKHRAILADKRTLYFCNSPQHLARNRIAQILLILEHFVDDETVDEMWSYVWDTLFIEYQPSVRYQLEWLALRILLRYPNRADDIFAIRVKLAENKNIALCSLLSILSHVGPCLPTSMQESFYDRALKVTLPFCMAHHLNIRIHAQAALIQLWRQCEDRQWTAVTDRHSVLVDCIDISDSSHSSKCVAKLGQHFFFRFDPSRDYSLQTIFNTLPKLSGVLASEFIAPCDFLQHDASWSCDAPSRLPLINSCDSLSNCIPGPWRLKGQEVAEQNSGDDATGDFQKKILPWRFMNTDDMGELENRERKDGLILVTSLIDKIPNLGGLCRTSEIFGVSEFVIGCLKHTEDRVFQSLSVTAHKWLPITEVTKAHLREYLLNKQTHGYTLVGVEQTANSECLTKYQFPKKSLLLLGNEKQGIPVDLIQILDVCVEIPQQGVIRSLNVHVSGALLVWEYARQQLIKS